MSLTRNVTAEIFLILILPPKKVKRGRSDTRRRFRPGYFRYLPQPFQLQRRAPVKLRSSLRIRRYPCIGIW